MSNGKGIKIVLIVGLINKDLYKNESKPFWAVKVDLFNYTTKTDLKNIT